MVRGHFGPINTVAFHPDGQGFVTGNARLRNKRLCHSILLKALFVRLQVSRPAICCLKYTVAFDDHDILGC